MAFSPFPLSPLCCLETLTTTTTRRRGGGGGRRRRGRSPSGINLKETPPAGQRWMEWMEEACSARPPASLSVYGVSEPDRARAAQWGRNQVMRETAGNWNSEA